MPPENSSPKRNPSGEEPPRPEVSDVELDMDTLHILPLGAMPVQTSALKRARLVKNIRLESMVELFGGDATGSGQVDPAVLGKVFDWPTNRRHPDERIVRSLSTLPSFDVYSLRIQLRKLGMDSNASDRLKLSEAKANELTRHMANFTMPLIRHVYGNTDRKIESVGELLKMFSAPNKQEALQNLRQIADRLDIGLMEVPKFLEEYGDVYLSLAYYRDCLDHITPQIRAFEESMDDLKSNHQLRNDRRLMHCVDRICDLVSNLTNSVLNRFAEFDRNSTAMWDDPTAVSFSRVKESIRRDHVAIGGILCGLTVKMGGWESKFKPGSGVVRRAEFVMSDMIQGLDLIGQLEESGTSRAGLADTFRVTAIPA